MNLEVEGDMRVSFIEWIILGYLSGLLMVACFWVAAKGVSGLPMADILLNQQNADEQIEQRLQGKVEKLP